MNWHNLSDKDFDAKIKSHVENKGIPFDSNAWTKMSVKLDQKPWSENNSRNGSLWGLLAIIGLLAGLFFWNIAKNQGEPLALIAASSGGITKEVVQVENPTSPKQEPSVTNEDRDNAVTDSNLDHEATAISGLQSNETNDNADGPTPSSGLNQNTLEGSDLINASQHQITESFKASDQRDNQPPTALEHTGDISAEPKTVVDRQTASNNIGEDLVKATLPVAGTEESTAIASKDDQTGVDHLTSSDDSNSPKFSLTRNTNQTDDNKQVPTRTSKVTIEEDLEDPALGSGQYNPVMDGKIAAINPFGPHMKWMNLSLPESPHNPQTIQAETSPPVTNTSNSKWSVGIGYAPDLSLVGFSDLTSPGTNVALSLDYRLGSRWSIQTGATIAKKRYIAQGEDYNPPSGFWAYSSVPDRADAVCTVIDIPINVRYYFSQKNRRSFYASMGLSTYFMLRENYDYSYKRNYPGLLYNWDVSNENQHVLGIYNLSVGYQRALSANWSMEIEPFIKAPLAGIGFGRVNLWSTGTMFSLRFTIP